MVTMLTIEELDGLPEKLIAELGITKTERVNVQVFSFIKGKGQASINEIILHLYRENGVITKRTNLVGRVYRLQQRGILEAADKKGVYKLAQKENNEHTKSN